MAKLSLMANADNENKVAKINGPLPLSAKNSWDTKCRLHFMGKSHSDPRCTTVEQTTAEGIRVKQGSFVFERIYGD